MPHYTFWHLHINKNRHLDDPIGVMVLGKTCSECQKHKEKRLEDPIEILKKKWLESKLTKAQKQSIAFITIAEKNNGIVTYAQAAEINPKYPSDPANYCRQKGWTITTDRKNKIFKVGDYAPKR